MLKRVLRKSIAAHLHLCGRWSSVIEPRQKSTSNGSTSDILSAIRALHYNVNRIAGSWRDTRLTPGRLRQKRNLPPTQALPGRRVRAEGANSGPGDRKCWRIAAIEQIIFSVTLTQLSAFVMVARLGSVKDAAKMLNVSEAAVSQALTALRQHLGDLLIMRNGATMSLTTAGVKLLPVASQMVALGAEAQAAVRPDRACRNNCGW